jgi:hypothetical protein
MAHATLVVSTTFLVLTILYYGHWVVLRRRFVAITPRQVYQSGAMSPARLMRYVRRYSIATVMDFRGPNEKGVGAEREVLVGTGVKYINIPIGILPSRDELRRFMDIMNEELQAGRPVLMHCKDGQGRAIALAAIYRIEFEGWEPSQAYRAATRLPPGFRPISILFPGAGLLSPRNPKTPFILNYSPTRRTLDAPVSVCVGETSA